MKKLLVLLLAVMCMFSLAACGGEKEETGTASASAIKLGGSGPISEVAKQYGDAVKNGAQLAVDEIKELNGGVDFFDFKFEDDNHSPDLARTAYYDLLDWGMQVSLGTVTTKPGEEVAADYAADGIFALTPSASGPKVTELGAGNVFQMCFSDPNQGSASADYIINHNLCTKAAVIYNAEDDYSKGIYEKFVGEAEGNFEIVYVGTFNEGDSDFNTQLSKAQENGAELIFLPIYYDPAYLILDQANKMGYNPIFFGVDGMDGILTVPDFDTSLAEGVYLLTPFSADATDEKTVNFVKNYQEKYGETPIQFAADSYDCVYAIYQACVNGNVTADMSASAIADIMKAQFTSMSFVGVTGTTVWNEKGEANKTPRAVVIRNGVYVEE